MKFRARLATAALAVFALVGVPVVAAAAGDDAGSVVQPEVQASVPLKAPSQKDIQKTDGLSAAAATCMFPVSATNSMLQTKTVTSRDARFYSTTAWTDLECGQLTVTVPRGRTAGLVVRTDAEVTCTELGSANRTEWCEGRVLVNGVGGEPAAQEVDGSFAWARSSLDAGAWESNSFTRSRTLRCPVVSTTLLPCSFDVRVQVKNHNTGLNFRVDDSTVEAQLTYM